jgi:hypothetical protein
MCENEQILQEIREIRTNDDYFPRDNESLDTFSARIDEMLRTAHDYVPVDEIAQCIIDGKNDIARVLYDATAANVHFLGCYVVNSDYSLIEIAVRVNNMEAVQMICKNNASDATMVIIIRSLYLAITFGFSEIAMYLYDIESQALFPDDVSTLNAIHLAIHYQNNVLVTYFIDQFKQNHSEIVELL